MRKSKDQWFEGVIAGIAEHYGWDVFPCRMAFIMLLMSPIPVGLMYLVCALCMKEPINETD